MRVLFLTHRLPYAANRGDRIRALHILRMLGRHAEVDLVSLVHNATEQAHAADLGQWATSVTAAPLSRLRGYVRAITALPTDCPFTHAILDAPTVAAACRRLVDQHPPDVVLAYCSGMARFALEPPLNAIPLVFDMVDVDSEKWRTLGRTAAAPARWVYATEATRLSAFEARASRRAEAVLVVNDRERASLLRLEPTANVRVVPNGVALDEFRPPGPPSTELRVTFCGVMNYQPNEEAALWFARTVWPMIRARHSAARLSLVGSDPTAAVRQLAAIDSTIEVTGSVFDVRPHLWRSAVAVAPLLMARGLQNKVLEAVAAGLPCVVTPAVHEGLPADILPGCIAGADAGEFATAVLDLLDRRPAERRAIADRASVASLSWNAQLATLMPILNAAARRNVAQLSAVANVQGRDRARLDIPSARCSGR